MEVEWRDGDERQPVMWIPATRASFLVSDVTFYQSVISFIYRVRRDEFCVVPSSVTTLLEQPGIRAALIQNDFDRGTLSVSYLGYAVPSTADFQALRHVPFRPFVACRLSVDAATAEVTDVEYTADAVTGPLQALQLPVAVTPERLPLLQGFPCQAEADRIAAWFDRTNLVPRDERTLPLVQQLLSGTATKTSAGCFKEVDAVTRTMNLEWDEATAPAPPAPCDQDLALARAYHATPFASAIRAPTASAMERAAAAAHAGDTRACLLATAAIRRAYFDALAGRPIQAGG